MTRVDVGVAEHLKKSRKPDVELSARSCKRTPTPPRTNNLLGEHQRRVDDPNHGRLDQPRVPMIDGA